MYTRTSLSLDKAASKRSPRNAHVVHDWSERTLPTQYKLKLVRVHPSKFLSVIILSGLIFAFTSIVVCHISWLSKIFFLLLLVSYTLYNLLKYGLLFTQRSIVSCQPLKGRFWRLTCRSGEVFLAEQSVYPYRSFYLIVLYFYIHSAKKRVKVPIAFDATAKLTYIRLLSKLLLERSY